MEDNRKRYKTICYKCGHEMWSCKSIGQEIGFSDYGYSHCLNDSCGVNLKMVFDEENQEMITSSWKKHMEEMTKQIEEGEFDND